MVLNLGWTIRVKRSEVATNQWSCLRRLISFCIQGSNLWFFSHADVSRQWQPTWLLWHSLLEGSIQWKAVCPWFGAVGQNTVKTLWEHWLRKWVSVTLTSKTRLADIMLQTKPKEIQCAWRMHQYFSCVAIFNPSTSDPGRQTNNTTASSRKLPAV